MFRKLLTALFILIILAAAFIGWRFFTSGTAFTENSKYLHIPTDKANYAYLLQTIRDSQLVKNPGSFDVLARQMNLDTKVKPGRYEIKKGMSLVEIVRMLRNGRQSPVKFTINKLRTEEGLASMVGRKFDCDSAELMAFLKNEDSLKRFGLDTNTWMTMIFPDTYTYFWNSTAGTILKKFHDHSEKVWTEERRAQAQQRGLTPVQAYILASIVEPMQMMKKAISPAYTSTGIGGE